MSGYNHTATFLVPESLQYEGNHLALLMGESSYDISTFNRLSQTDGEIHYAMAHSLVKAVFLAPLDTGSLPPTPPHAEGTLDREAAQRAFDSLGQPGGIRMAIDVDPFEQLAEWGVYRIPPEEGEDG